MLSQSFTFSILDYSFEEHPIKIIEDVFWQLRAFKFIIILPHKLSERIKLSKVTKYPSTDIDILAQPQLGWAPL